LKITLAATIHLSKIWFADYKCLVRWYFDTSYLLHDTRRDYNLFGIEVCFTTSRDVKDGQSGKRTNSHDKNKHQNAIMMNDSHYYDASGTTTLSSRERDASDYYATADGTAIRRNKNPHSILIRGGDRHGSSPPPSDHGKHYLGRMWNNFLKTALPSNSLEGFMKSCLAVTVVLYVLNQKHLLPKPLSAVVSKALFYPSLPITAVRRLGTWSTVVDDTVIVGGAPFQFVQFPEKLYHEYGVSVSCIYIYIYLVMFVVFFAAGSIKFNLTMK